MPCRGSAGAVRAGAGDQLSSPSITLCPLTHDGSGATTCQRGFELFRGADGR